MPLTELEYPILQQFFCVVESRTGLPPQPLEATPQQRAMAEQHQQEEIAKAAPPVQQQQAALPKGVVLGPDGKP